MKQVGDIRKSGWAKDVTLETDLRLLSPKQYRQYKKRGLFSFQRNLLKLRPLWKKNWASKWDPSGFLKTLISPEKRDKTDKEKVFLWVFVYWATLILWHHILLIYYYLIVAINLNRKVFLFVCFFVLVRLKMGETRGAPLGVQSGLKWGSVTFLRVLHI